MYAECSRGKRQRIHWRRKTCVGAGVSLCNMPKPLDLSPQSDFNGTKSLRPSHCGDLMHCEHSGLCTLPAQTC